MPVTKTKKKTGKKRFVAELHITHAFTKEVESMFTGIDLTGGLPLPDIDIISNDYI